MAYPEKYVYRFGKLHTDGDKSMKMLLGGKGANLAEMSTIGIPVPPGFTISTEACQKTVNNQMSWPETLDKQIEDGVRHIEKEMGLKLGDRKDPLLISVRSGAAVSMPGMMDTILNLGINDRVVEALIAKTGNERFAYDSYRRFIDMFGDVVMGVSHEYFEEAIEKLKKEVGVEQDIDLTAEQLRELTDRYKAIYRKVTGHMFPDDPMEQLKFAVNAVFNSWNSARAIKYRQISNIHGLIGTAVNVQAMVFGNMGEKSGTGVCFTRNPATGEHKLYGEFLLNAQGEDVVAGIRTPSDIDELERLNPDIFNELLGYTHKLEAHYKNMQDIEFTIQEGTLYILQTRNGKRTGTAALKIAVNMVDEGLLPKEEAIRDLVEPGHIEQLLHPQFKEDALNGSTILGKGLPASPGAAVGKVVFDSKRAEEAEEKGDPVILVRIETSPEDVGGMSSAEGILTSRGGMTSHAAVVARGWGKPCVAGCSDIVINYKARSFTNGDVTIKEGDWISLNGNTGEVLKGKKELTNPEFGKEYRRFMNWVGEIEDMQVRANAETPEDAETARSYGAKGIGLARTEHMFFKPGRVKFMRKMIIANNEVERRAALAKLLPFQKQDFIEIFEVMEGLPVTIRLLDPPLHEFLPQEEDEIKEVAEELEVSTEVLKDKINLLKEFNPMLGHRGCRLGITYPEITEMQTRAIIEAVIELKKSGKTALPEIMIPLVSSMEEFRNQRKVVDDTAKAVLKEFGETADYKIGTMIEIPRAAILADQIAEEADFFSFGTNDLTQLTFGFSRDDAVKFLPIYMAKGIIKQDPFQVLDEEGVGQFVQAGTRLGRMTNPNLKIGICGEHGGDPDSVNFAYQTGLNYVSCSPFRVPVAHLASAQAVLRKRRSESPNEQELSTPFTG
ncbi:pyruvate, phosphate dikinase [Gracilimonas mengyeensis]|uniref:Pyruvate, phosphate dikinase n=1 Tax=Gracilimonas mengyeensis TaxID=1302730 RepID=A0A521AFT8_9BACT|nr:pyruvate, phosphate dikinase [Gracilimonas mengyeensis]SMO33656.1 pyruvate phosphate dikinase [Gracilimonas mengyeensis]